MTTSIINGICRCCSADHPLKDLTSTYNWMGEDEIYMDMLRECFDLSIRVTPNTMGGICEVCITQLRNAYNFKKQVIVTEEMFTKKLEEESYNADIKLENKEDVDLENLEDDPNFSDYDVPIKMEELIIDEDSDEKKTKKRRNAKKCSSAKKIKTESGTSKSSTKPVIDKPIKAKRSNLVVAETVLNHLREKRERRPDTSQLNLHDSTVSLTPKRFLPNKSTEGQYTLSNLKNILMYSNANIIRSYDNGGYSCGLCNSQYLEPIDLKRHFLTEHSNEKCIARLSNRIFQYTTKLDVTFLNCSLCDTDLKSLEDFMRHLGNNHSIRLYDVSNSILPFKFETPGFHCAICNSERPGFKSLLEHMQSHYRNYICGTCGAGFATKFAWNNHVKRKCRAKDKNYECSHCDKVFNTEEYKTEHERRIHLGVKRYTCKICFEKFYDQYKRINHSIQVHGIPSPYQEVTCKACDKVFQSHRRLQIHIRRDHMMERNHHCPKCEMSFFVSSDLKNHMIRHIDAPKVFACSKCPKAYDRKKTLLNHMRVHVEVSPFQCDICVRSFTQKCSLKYHMKLKHGVVYFNKKIL